MKESQFGFEYSWDDLKPIRPLAVAALLGQLSGAGLGLLLPIYASSFANLWAGGAVATFPSFLLGLLVQHQLNSDAIRENRTMVIRFGLVALVLSLSVFIMPLDRM